MHTIKVGKKKSRSTEAFVYFQCFHRFQIFKVSLLKTQKVICFINFFPKISNYVIIFFNL